MLGWFLRLLRGFALYTRAQTCRSGRTTIHFRSANWVIYSRLLPSSALLLRPAALNSTSATNIPVVAVLPFYYLFRLPYHPSDSLDTMTRSTVGSATTGHTMARQTAVLIY